MDRPERNGIKTDGEPVREKSCGAVIFRREDGGTLLYLLEHMRRGHCSLCKGHTESGETEHQTAVREIREETGLSVSFRAGFRETIAYSPAPGVIKDVVFYLAEPTGGTEIPQPEEVSSLVWLPFPDAEAALTHESDREVLRKADRFLSAESRGESLIRDAEIILSESVRAVLPEESVRTALKDLPPLGTCGKRILVAAGKAAWDMADAAVRFLKEPVSDGIVITKHGHARGPIGPLKIREAGHPVPDADTFRATEEVLALTSGLGPEDRVLFLVSGGGSALFEKPLIPEEEYASLTAALLKSGIPIGPFNAVRKHLSAVKGGRFALHCLPASVDAVILSDVIGDPPDVIASGPVTADKSTSEEAISVLRSLAIPISERTEAVLRLETPKSVPNVSFRVTGSLKRLCGRAAETAAGLGYVPEILTCELQGDASEAGERFAEYANRVLAERSPLPGNAKRFAFLAGGETTVRVTGNGTGGRCQEMAVSCAKGLRGKEGVLFFAFGSDGTDGPTDAAGGFADGRTLDRMEKAGFAADTVLRNNDSYHALEAVGNLLVTGPTGTNVNDLAVLLVRTAPS